MTTLIAIDRLARRWLLRKGAEWRRETCETCRDMAEFLNSTAGVCRTRHQDTRQCENACPAWRRKETI